MLIAHADWSKHPHKRWMTVIGPDRAGWRITAPEPVGDPATLLARLLARARGAPVALGLDCPIGLPRAYAALHATEADFPSFLRRLHARPGFLEVCETLEDISSDRPFYPARGVAGMTRAAHAHALGLEGAAALCRACDRATAERPAGAPVFWTLGANQSGKAAISAWREVLAPAQRGPDPPRLWPFDGAFRALLAPGRVAVAETYPAEAMRQLGVRMAGSKRRQADRAALAEALGAAMARLRAAPNGQMGVEMAGGFGAHVSGEDRLDSVFGALCVLAVATGQRSDAAPDDPWIMRWEGWVLGQTALPIPARQGDLATGALAAQAAFNDKSDRH